MIHDGAKKGVARVSRRLFILLTVSKQMEKP